MADRDTEGEWIKGWPDRKRATLVEGKDQQGRTILARSPAWELEGMITPTDLSYIVAQLDMPEPIHPDDWSLEIAGEVEQPIQLSFQDLRNFPSRTVRAVTECAGNDGNFSPTCTRKVGTSRRDSMTATLPRLRRNLPSWAKTKARPGTWI